MTGQQWHYERDGQRVGPFHVQELPQLVQAGLIHPDTPLLHQNGSRIPAGDLLVFGAEALPADDVVSESPPSLDDSRPPLPPKSNNTATGNGDGPDPDLEDTGAAASLAEGARETTTEPIEAAPASASPLPLPPSLPAPPPLPQPEAYGLPVTVAASQAASGKQSHETHPWNPRVIGQLGILFSPIWVGIMAAINSRRLQTGLPFWRPIMIGIGVTILDIVVSLVTGGYYFVDLILYLGALGLIWHLDLKPQINAFSASQTKCVQTASWLVPTLVGGPAAVFVFLTFVVGPFIPDSQPEEQTVSASTSNSDEEGFGEGSSTGEPSDSPGGLRYVYRKYGWLGVIIVILGIAFVRNLPNLLDRFTEWIEDRGRNKVTSKAIKTYYTDPVSVVQAQTFADFMTQVYPDDKRRDFEIGKKGDIYHIRIPVKEGAEKDTSRIEPFRPLIPAASKIVFAGAPVEIHICDSSMKTLAVLPWEETSGVELVDSDGQRPSATVAMVSCPADVQAAASADPGNPFSQTAVPTVATPEEIRLSHWTRLREIARWRRRAQFWFIAPLVFVVIAVVVPDSLGFFVNIVFWMLLILWVPVWIWLTAKLRRALGSSDTANDVLDYLLPGYLDLRAHSVLRGAGVEVKLLKRDLPEEPPAWFHP